ncbi:succinate--hydroxymethylglutarate CoA-transferase isoform X13 [Equus przewalskii]|uniref:Succinate--hydroxymethylglutarate CoA-transferase isoform X13 n=1 Tax=Equus przewalskii TaxID=9798 RepID=A0ABM4P310_EQUPR
MASAVSRSLVGTDGRNVRPAVTRARSAPAGPPGRLARGGAGPGGSAGAPSGCGRRAAFSPRAGADELRRAMLARGAALRRTGLLCGRGGGRGLWTGRPQSGAGDDTRAWGPPFLGTESVYFLSVNRNKKSIAVNIKDPKGVKIVKELAAVCDVFVENYVPGKLSAVGLGYEDIDKIAPHIIYCSITGFGQTGPLSRRAGYDSVASAVSGLMHITGPEDGDPVRPGVAMTDLATGLYAYGAIMAGLIQRYKTGKGLFVDCNLLSSQAFKTKDGYLVVGAGNNQQFATVCKILNLPELIDDSKYKTNHLRVQNRKELIKILSARFEEEMTSKWLYLFEGSGIPYGPINNMKNVFAEPQVLHNGLIMEMKHPTVGKISVPGPAVRYSKFKMSEARPPPLLGQHTTHILKEVLRYDDRAIEELLSAGVVTQHEAE